MTTKTPCADTPDLFWSTTPADETKAKALCSDCPLRAACAQQAIDNDETAGTWGGLTAGERLQLRRGVGWWIDDEGRARKPCGSDSAYRAHLKYKEPPCEPCTVEHARIVEQDRRRTLRRAHALPAGGSVTGYSTHRKLGEEPCEACLAAVAVRSAASRARRASRLAAVPDPPAVVAAARPAPGSAAA